MDESMTRERFERMTALDSRCPLRACNAAPGEPCVTLRLTIPREQPHKLRERATKRLQDAAFRFFDLMTVDAETLWKRGYAAYGCGIPFSDSYAKHWQDGWRKAQSICEPSRRNDGN